MILDDAVKIIDALIFLMPGFLALRIYYGYYPSRPPSDFTSILLSIITGAIINSIGIALDDYFFNGAIYSTADVKRDTILILYLLVCGIISGYILVCQRWLIEYLSTNYRCFHKIAPNHETAWKWINRKSNRDWCIVYLSDGSQYQGWIDIYQWDPTKEDQDFILESAKRVDPKSKSYYLYEVTGEGVYINLRNVVKIEYFKGS